MSRCVLHAAQTRATVTLHRAPDAGATWRIDIDGRLHTARVLRWRSPQLTLLLDDHRLLDACVQWSGTTGVVTVGPSTATISTTTSGTTASELSSVSDGPLRITAPLPGRIVSVCVTADAEVNTLQTLCIIEAMKMQNEITAPRAGRLTTLAVQPGQTVETGALLAVIA